MLPEAFVEEEIDISPLRVPADSIHRQDISGINELVQLQAGITAVSRPRMAGLSYRLGIAVLLSMIIALLAYEFWPFEIATSDTSQHSVQKMMNGMTTQIPKYGTDIPNTQPSVQATTNPVVQATNQPTVQSSLQTPTQKVMLPSSQGSTTTTNMLVYFYGWTDNSPPGASIAYPKLHSSAGGMGTYSNPITFGTSANELSPGTIIYVQYFKKYFIMEDECSACDPDWKNNHRYEIVLWIGGDANSSNSAIQDCKNSLTPKSSVPVVVQPSSNLTVDTTPLFTDSGGCIKL